MIKYIQMVCYAFKGLYAAKLLNKVSTNRSAHLDDVEAGASDLITTVASLDALRMIS